MDIDGLSPPVLETNEDVVVVNNTESEMGILEDNDPPPAADSTAVEPLEEVQVISKQDAEREIRRRRKRNLFKMLTERDRLPSFLAILQSDPMDLEKEDEEDVVIDHVVIDVDAYLGLRTTPLSKPVDHPSYISSSDPVKDEIGSTPPPTPSYTSSTSGRQIRPPTTFSLSAAPFKNPDTVLSTTIVADSETGDGTTAADEGWYEGTRSLAMPEDGQYLSDLHLWVRRNLEFFSATVKDATKQGGRSRTPLTVGKVGIRCIHCAKFVLSQTNVSKNTWPLGAVSYPHNITGLHSTTSQKAQSHFESCPHLPPDNPLRRLLNHAKETGSSESTKRKRLPKGMSTLLYYAISCARIGVVETPKGMRFGRDLSLDPLAMEASRLQAEQDHPEMMTIRSPRPSNTKSSVMPKQKGATPSRVVSAPVVVDPSSQAVLQTFFEGLEQETPRSLLQMEDRGQISDFMALIIGQISLCHATVQDKIGRGKRPRNFKLGMAGFHCKHCERANVHHSGRSFCSHPDNLASSISNFFVLHMQKCSNVPAEIPRALIVLKKIHSRQMQQLPYGSQRKMFGDLWNRLRKEDKHVEEDVEMEGNIDPQEEWTPDTAESATVRRRTSTELPQRKRIKMTIDPFRPNTRDANFPVCDDERTSELLKRSEDNWDLEENQNLISKDDRQLISDYVFLTMRQLKIANPRPEDFRGNRRNNILSRMAGMCCIHCDKASKQSEIPPHISMMPSGRSFPSAPDNMASALNSSLYNHFQNCAHLPTEYKHAFQQLKKIHSLQCARLRFGSQRRFFNKVFAKLQAIPVDPSAFSIQAKTFAAAVPAKPSLSDEVLQQHCFLVGERLPHGEKYWQCLQCRMVPFQFQAPGAIHFSPPSVTDLSRHQKECQQDGMHLGMVKAALEKVRISVFDKEQSTVNMLRPIIRCAVGGDEDLVQLFLNPASLPPDFSTKGLWHQFSRTINFDQVECACVVAARDLKLSSDLIMNKHLKHFLQMISPFLIVPKIEDDTSSNDSHSIPEKVDISSNADANVSVAEVDEVPVNASILLEEEVQFEGSKVDDTAQQNPANFTPSGDASQLGSEGKPNETIVTSEEDPASATVVLEETVGGEGSRINGTDAKPPQIPVGFTPTGPSGVESQPGNEGELHETVTALEEDPESASTLLEEGVGTGEIAVEDKDEQPPHTPAGFTPLEKASQPGSERETVSDDTKLS